MQPSLEAHLTMRNLTFATLILTTGGLYGQVFTLPATDIITKPASLLDLQERTLRFTPVAGQAGAYRVENLPLEWQGAAGAGSGTVLANNNTATTTLYAASWQQPIGFAFPYAGRTYTQLFVNLNGNLSFDTPETAQMPANRDPWPDGTVRSVAATLDTRSLARQETIIAALWQLNLASGTRVSVLRQADRFVATWDAERRYLSNVGYDPIGRNLFQAVLYPSGQIDLSYSAIAEPDGIAGLFQGAGATFTGTRIDNVARPNANAPDPVVTIRNLELSDLGTALRWRFTMAAPAPSPVPSGELWYRIFLTINGRNCEASLGFAPTGSRVVMNCGSGRNAMAWQVNGATVDLMVSKLTLDNVTSFSWGSDVVWFGFAGRFDQVNLQQRRPVTLTPEQANAEIDFSAAAPGSPQATQPRAGNLIEAFHYPVVSKALNAAPLAAYQTFAPDDDFFVPMLDFRPDDLFNHGPSTGQIGTGLRVENIGTLNSNLEFSSNRLQVAISPLDFNGQRLREWVTANRRDYFNYAQAVAWIAHEITHRWTAFLSFRDGTVNRPLASGAHWLPELNTPAVEPVWRDYSFSEYPERSIMDGGLYRELPDGRFQMQELTYIIPAGFSGLDLYAMGLIAAEEMPGTYLIRNRQAAGPNVFTGQKVPVRGTDVVAAMGPRRPSVADSQKEFKLGVYLFYDPSRSEPNPETLRNARQITLQTANFFSRASGGRMTVIPSAPMDVPLPVIADVVTTEAGRIAISGEALAVYPTAPPGENFVAQWNGTSVTVGGKPAAVRRVAPDSLEVRLPADLPADEDLPVVVTTRRGPSEPFVFRLTAPANLER